MRLPHASYFGSAYFRAACPVGCGAPSRRGRSGFGQSFDPTLAANQAGGAGVAYASQATAGLQAQGQNLYSTANQYAAAGTGVANGNLSSVVAASNLTANQVPPGQTQNALRSIGKDVTAATLGYAMTSALLTEGLTVLGATAAEVASAVPVFGTAVAAMIIATELLLSSPLAASGGTIVTMPPVGQALLAVPLPIPSTSTSQGLTAGPIEPPLADPTAEIPAGGNCNTSSYLAGDKIGGALGAWRDYLDFAQQGNPTNAYATALANGAPIPLPPDTDVPKGGFSSGCVSWQACADEQLVCVGFGLSSIGGGEPMAEAAVSLAIRWIPYGDPLVAPYNNGNGVLAGWNVMQGLQANLAALAYSYAAWPQAYADQQALAYLTALAWTWTNYPGGGGPIPAWIAYKLGHLQNVVAQDGLISQASAVATSTAASQQATAAVAGGLAMAAAAAPTVYALVTKQRIGSVWGRLLGR